MVKKYMKKYGIDAVRGGSYSQVQLSAKQREFLSAELRTAAGSCFVCGRSGHLCRQCPGRLKLTFGKYDGWTLKEVQESDPAYIQWIRGQERGELSANMRVIYDAISEI